MKFKFLSLFVFSILCIHANHLVLVESEILGSKRLIFPKKRKYEKVTIKRGSTPHLYNMKIEKMIVEKGAIVHIYGTIVEKLVGEGLVYRHTLIPFSKSRIIDAHGFYGKIKPVHCGLKEFTE